MHLCHILVELRQAHHKVQGQAVVGGLGGVDGVPENMVVKVGTDWVVVAASQGSKEGWSHVAGAGGVSETLL